MNEGRKEERNEYKQERMTERINVEFIENNVASH